MVQIPTSPQAVSLAQRRPSRPSNQRSRREYHERHADTGLLAIILRTSHGRAARRVQRHPGPWGCSITILPVVVGREDREKTNHHHRRVDHYPRGVFAEFRDGDCDVCECQSDHWDGPEF